MKKRRSIPFLIALNVATFGVTFWGSVTNPGFYQFKLERLAAHDVINTLLGLFASSGLIVATVAQPFMGALSDRTRSRFGRRAPYLIVGALGVSLAAFAIAGANSLLILLSAILFGQLASNTVQGPWQALSPDQVPDEQKGLSAGFKTVFDLLAVLASGFVISGLLAKEQTVAVALILSGTILITALITAVSAPDRGAVETAAPTTQLFDALRRFVLPDYRNLRWWFLNRLLFWAGLTALRQFIISYLQDVGGYPNNAAISLSGEFTILLGVGTVIITLPAGFLSDRVGRKGLIALSCFIAFIGSLALLFAREAGALRLVAIVAGAGVGMYFSINWALVTALVPTRDAALFLGIANIATTLGGLLGQLGGPLIDGVNKATVSVNGYFVLFGLAALFFLLSAGAITRIDEGAAGGTGALADSEAHPTGR